jgi:hypothetical protein
VIRGKKRCSRVSRSSARFREIRGPLPKACVPYVVWRWVTINTCEVRDECFVSYAQCEIPSFFPMPLPDHLLEEIGRRREDEAREADRDKLFDYVRSAIMCVLWAAAGIVCIMWSAHLTDMQWAWAAFYSGIGIGNGGVIFTLLGTYRRGEKRGDW